MEDRESPETEASSSASWSGEGVDRAASPARFPTMPRNVADAVSRMIMVLVMVFVLRILLTSMVVHQVLNTTLPYILQSMFVGYDRSRFRPLPWFCTVMWVAMLVIVFPTK